MSHWFWSMRWGVLSRVDIPNPKPMPSQSAGHKASMSIQRHRHLAYTISKTKRLRLAVRSYELVICSSDEWWDCIASYEEDEDAKKAADWLPIRYFLFFELPSRQIEECTFYCLNSLPAKWKSKSCSFSLICLAVERTVPSQDSGWVDDGQTNSINFETICLTVERHTESADCWRVDDGQQCQCHETP